jgi:glucose-6-phosphate isomerase
MSVQLTDSEAWRALAGHADDIRGRHLRELFAADARRFEQLSCRHGDLLIDYSKQRVTSETLEQLRRLAKTAGIRDWMQRMQAGEAINHTENRAVRHTALRAGAAAPAEVKAVLARMADFCERIHSGQWRGHGGERITDVVNIGIGGSDLGPRMAVHALAAHGQPDLRVHFVSNLDGADLASRLTRLNPRSTLFIVASKTFTTLETISNARTARHWLLATAGDEKPWPGISSPLRPTCRQPPNSASPRKTSSSSATGSVAAFRCGRRSACRSHWPSASAISKNCWPAPTTWTPISSRRQPRRTCR